MNVDKLLAAVDAHVDRAHDNYLTARDKWLNSPPNQLLLDNSTSAYARLTEARDIRATVRGWARENTLARTGNPLPGTPVVQDPRNYPQLGG